MDVSAQKIDTKALSPLAKLAEIRFGPIFLTNNFYFNFADFDMFLYSEIEKLPSFFKNFCKSGLSNIRDLPTKFRASCLTKDVNHRIHPIEPRDALLRGQSDHLFQSLLLHARYNTFRKCIRLIEKIAPLNHSIHISDYRNVTPSDSGRIELCPYCCALSIWMMYVHSYPYGLRSFIPPSMYQIYNEIVQYTFFEPMILVDVYDGSNSYRAPRDFIEWSYSRELEICFAELLTLNTCLNDLVRAQYPISKWESTAKALHEQVDCFFFVDENKLHYFYKAKSVLNCLRRSIKTITEDTCNNGHRNIDRSTNQITPFTFHEKPLTSVSLNIESFNIIESNVRKYLSKNENEDEKMKKWYSISPLHYGY